jgi:hypothetical protein
VSEPAAAGLPKRLGLANEGVWGFIAELGHAAEVAARELGIDARQVDTGADEAEVDTMLAIGSVRLYPNLIARPHVARRVLWHIEPLPRSEPESGSPLHRWLPTGKLLDVSRSALPPFGRSATWRRWREEAANVREPVTNLALMRRHRPALDRIVIDTLARAEGALSAGLDVAIVPFGYHAAYAGTLTAPASDRDIPVLSLASVDPVARRQRVLPEIEATLGRSGAAVAHVERHTYGAARTDVLRRSKVVLDVHRVPGSHPLYRFILAAAAGAALVSEPLDQPQPLVPGVHYMEAATSRLGEATLELLADEPRRRRIVDAAQALLTGELDLRRTLPIALGSR